MSDPKKFIQENPLDVIERFGGIRPMATKLGIAATTIQGWKKRESIPDSRIRDIIEVAYKNQIDLMPSNENYQEEETRPNIEDTIAQIKAKIEQPPQNPEQPDEEILDFSREDDDDDRNTPPIEKPPAFISEKEEDQPEETETDTKPEASNTTHDKPAAPATTKNPANTNTSESCCAPKAAGSGSGGWLLSILIGLAVIALAAVFWPVKEDVQQNKERLAEVEANISEIKEDQSSFMNALSGYMPEDIQSQIETFKKQTGELGEQVGELAQQTKDMASSIIGAENTEALQARLNALEGQFADMLKSVQVGEILGRFSIMNDTEEGQEKLDRATGQLHGIIGSLDGRMDLLGEALVVARENSTALGETFNGVPNEDLKAAALLLGLTQFRSALNRNNTPFEEDLVLLYNMVGDDNTELKQSLDRLAPQAASGVLTTKGLADEFRALAGDIAVNSLKGEDVSIGEQATARLSKVLQIKKDGKNLLSDASEEKVQAVQSQLDSGDLRGAMATLSTFKGQAAQTAAPFMQELAATISAQEVTGAINSMLSKASSEFSRVKPINLKNPKPSITEQFMPNEVLKDEESGFTILPENKLNRFKELNVKIQE